MRYTLRKDRKNRLYFKNHENTLKFFKTLKNDQSLNTLYRLEQLNTIARWPKNRFSGRSKNHCVLTARSAGVLRSFSISRIRFRELANLGYLSGIRRSSW